MAVGRTRRRTVPSEASLTRADLPWLAGAVFFGGVLLIGAPSEWPLAVQVLYIAGIVAYWMILVRR